MPTKPPAPRESDGEPYCATCNLRGEDDSRFCTRCGSRLGRRSSADRVLARLQEALGARYGDLAPYYRGDPVQAYAAWDSTCNRAVNVWAVPADCREPDKVHRQFDRAIALAGPMYHPSVLPVLDAGVAGDVPFFTTPHMRGRWLDHRLRHSGALSLADTVRVVRGVAEALAYCHERDVLFGDVKPHNVLDFDTHVAIFDFTAAYPLSAGLDPLEVRDDTFVIATPRYMNPEQMVGERQDARSDLFSLGLVAYECLTGASPFAGMLAPQQFGLIVTSPEIPPPALERRPAQEFYDRVVRPLLQVDARRRPSDARALLAALHDFAGWSGDDPAPRADAPPEPYEGPESFIFVSYSRDDRPRVVPTMREMVRSGYNLWYDRGIPGGAEWDSLIEERIRACSGVVLFLSERSVESKFVRREVKFADRLNKPIVTVRLDGAELRHGLHMLLTQYQMLDHEFAGPDDVARALRFVHRAREQERVAVPRGHLSLATAAAAGAVAAGAGAAAPGSVPRAP